jgi:hypothetical protein
MPVVSRFYGIAIVFYWNDHAPPHFHAKYAGAEAMIEVATGTVLRGSLPERAHSLVEEWRKLRVAELASDWRLAREGKPLHYIEPLE